MNKLWQFVDYKHLEADHFLQSAHWANIRKTLGWNVAAIRIELDSSYTVLLLERSLVPEAMARIMPPFIPRSFIYSPYALSERASVCNTETLTCFRSCIYDACKQHFPSGVFFRWDVPFAKELCSSELLQSAGFRPAPVKVQAPDTVILDLNQSTEELLASFKPKTRYNIRLASRKSVEIQQSYDMADITRWYSLYLDTQKRQGMGIHTEGYYRSVFEGFSDAHMPGSIRLYTAVHEGDLLAGIVVLHYGKGATYLYGASSDMKRNYMASYLLQWHAICKAKEDGMAFYDLFGISPNADSSHPFYGLYRFKTGFGGSIIHRAGCWDIPLRKNFYAITRSLERRGRR